MSEKINRENATETWKQSIVPNDTSVVYRGDWVFSTPQISGSTSFNSSSSTGKQKSKDQRSDLNATHNVNTSLSDNGDGSRSGSKPEPVSLFSYTNDSTASVTLFFTGSKIKVLGLVPPGNASIQSKYTIDNGKSKSRVMPALAEDLLLSQQTIFESTDLQDGKHNITVGGIVTGGNRMFALAGFSVLTNTQSPTAQNSASMSRPKTGLQAGIVAGIVLGILAFLTLLTFFVVYFWKKRKRTRRVLPVSSSTNVTSLRSIEERDPSFVIEPSSPSLPPPYTFFVASSMQPHSALSSSVFTFGPGVDEARLIHLGVHDDSSLAVTPKVSRIKDTASSDELRRHPLL